MAAKGLKNEFENQSTETVSLGGIEFLVKKDRSKNNAAETLLPGACQEKDLSVSIRVDSERNLLKSVFILSKNIGLLMVRSRCLANEIYKHLSRINGKKHSWQPDILLSSGDGTIYLKNEVHFSEGLTKSPR